MSEDSSNGKSGSAASSTDRRGFLAASAVGLAACAVEGTMPPNVPGSGGAAVTDATIGEAEKLALVSYTAKERALIVGDQKSFFDMFRERRAIVFPNSLVPATIFDPRPIAAAAPIAPSIKLAPGAAAPLPSSDTDIAYAPVTALASWIEKRAITSSRLTEIYLARLQSIGAKLECVITLTPDLARAQAKAADAEIAAGKYKGSLHGIPWGAKDLLDTAGILTTWGAMPFSKRVPSSDATVVKRLADAGAVLVAKLATGELAKDDVWFAGRTKNPWNLLEGSGGSSAGPGSATAAGLVGFSIGSETLGSIVAPSMRCGTTGLRPTFGRVPRTGAMSLCWSLDKLGPITRTVEDAMLVLAAIQGPDHVDACTWPAPLVYDGSASIAGLKVGYDPAWFAEKDVHPRDHDILDVLRKVGLDVREIKLPKVPWDTMQVIVAAESAAAFEELVATDRDDELAEQHAGAWPNFLREARFLSAVDLVQAERLRRRTMDLFAKLFADVDLMVGPSFAGGMLTITNMTGHPSLTLRTSFVDRAPLGQEGDGDRPEGAPPLGPPTSMPRGITLWGRLYEEGTLCRVGLAVEQAVGLSGRRPPIG